MGDREINSYLFLNFNILGKEVPKILKCSHLFKTGILSAKTKNQVGTYILHLKPFNPLGKMINKPNSPDWVLLPDDTFIVSKRYTEFTMDERQTLNYPLHLAKFLRHSILR